MNSFYSISSVKKTTKNALLRKEEKIMANYENERYSAGIELSNDNRLEGLWSLIGAKVEFENDGYSLDQTLFGTDPIAYDVLSAIIRKNVNANKILVHPLPNDALTSDIQEALAEVTNPLLIAHAGSNFIVLLSDAPYGIDVWVWDLASDR